MVFYLAQVFQAGHVFARVPPLLHLPRCWTYYSVRFQRRHVFTHPLERGCARLDVQSLSRVRFGPVHALEAILDIDAIAAVHHHCGAVWYVAVARRLVRVPILCKSSDGGLHGVHAGSLWQLLFPLLHSQEAKLPWWWSYQKDGALAGDEDT